VGAWFLSTNRIIKVSSKWISIMANEMDQYDFTYNHNHHHNTNAPFDLPSLTVSSTQPLERSTKELALLSFWKEEG